MLAGGGGGGRSGVGDGGDVPHMINKHLLKKQTTGFCCMPFLHIPQNIVVSIPECPNSTGIIRHQDKKNSRPSCQISFHWIPAGIRVAL